MRSKKNRQQPPEAEGAAGEPKKLGTVASQTKTTRKLDGAVKRDAEERMAGREKAVERWEGEGGAVAPPKKGGKR